MADRRRRGPLAEAKGLRLTPEERPGDEPAGSAPEDPRRELDPADLAEPEVDPGGGGLADTVVRGVGLAGVGFVAAQALTLAFYLVLARLASPKDFGDYAAGTLLVNIGLLFTESGMMAALVHRGDRIDEAASTATLATALSGLFFTLLALAGSPLVGLAFDSSRVGEIAAASSALLLTRSLIIVPQALLQRRFSFLRRMFVEPAGVLAFGVVAIVTTANGLGAWGLVIGYYAAGVTDIVLSWVLVRWRPRLRQISWAMWRELAGYGRFVLAAHTVMLGTQQLPVLLIGRFSGAGPLGQYRYAERLSTTPVGFVIQAGSYVLFPAFARITDDRGRFREAMLRSLRLMCMLSFPLTALLIPLGVPAATLLFGDVWRDAGYATMVLAAEAMFGTMTSFASEALKADGHPELLTKVHVVLFTSSAIGMLALLAPLGFLGVCAGISIGSIVGSMYALRQVRTLNEIKLGDFVREVYPALVSSLAMAAAITPLEFLVVHAADRGTLVGLVLLAAEALAGLLVFAASMALLAPATVREMRDLVAGMILRRRAA